MNEEGEDDKFAGKLVFEPPSSTIEETIIIEVDNNLMIINSALLNENIENVARKSNYTKNGNVYCNSPDLSGFNPKCTYYVTFNDNGAILDESTKISEEPPAEWYDYSSSEKRWANIMTNNNGQKAYWVWIPRFKYKADATNKKSDVRFVSTDDKYYEDNEEGIPTEKQIDASYKLSDAFSFNDKQLSGYWISKYRVMNENKNPNAPNVNDSTSRIRIDLSGFNPECTYYVVYNDDGTVNDDSVPINEEPPNNWYDYGADDKKWANVVTKGKDNNGNELVTYWTYIPKFKYNEWKIIKQTDIEFISSSEVEESENSVYKIPASFTFNDKQLEGYWISKYRIQNGTTNTDFDGSYYKK